MRLSGVRLTTMSTTVGTSVTTASAISDGVSPSRNARFCCDAHVNEGSDEIDMSWTSDFDAGPLHFHDRCRLRLLHRLSCRKLLRCNTRDRGVELLIDLRIDRDGAVLHMT